MLSRTVGCYWNSCVVLRGKNSQYFWSWRVITVWWSKMEVPAIAIAERCNYVWLLLRFQYVRTNKLHDIRALNSMLRLSLSISSHSLHLEMDMSECFKWAHVSYHILHPCTRIYNLGAYKEFPVLETLLYCILISNPDFKIDALSTVEKTAKSGLLRDILRS